MKTKSSDLLLSFGDMMTDVSEIEYCLVDRGKEDGRWRMDYQRPVRNVTHTEGRSLSGCLAWDENGRGAVANGEWPDLETGSYQQVFCCGRKSRRQEIVDVVVSCLKHKANHLLVERRGGSTMQSHRIDSALLVLQFLGCRPLLGQASEKQLRRS